ncbi:MAG TPA: hypothetical protein VF131_28000, partial [Blastocatellia bacterium]|nr:hypothetical protein [Blastocatellia bacterium]
MRGIIRASLRALRLIPLLDPAANPVCNTPNLKCMSYGQATQPRVLAAPRWHERSEWASPYQHLSLWRTRLRGGKVKDRLPNSVFWSCLT